MKLIRVNTHQRALEHVRNIGPYETNKGKSLNLFQGGYQKKANPGSSSETQKAG